MRLPLIIIWSIAVCLSIFACYKYGFPLRPERLYSGYETVNPPFDENAQKAVTIAVIQILKSEFDTAMLVMDLMENDSSYLVDFNPKEIGPRIVKGDTILTVTADGNTTVIISKEDLKLLVHYGPF